MDAITTKFGAWLADLDLSEPRTQGVVLLAGLGLLALSLMVVMMTRWGQAKPLSKCIVLSVFAHFLLMVYAYSAHLWEDTPPLPEEVINVSLTAMEEDGEQDGASQQPWDQFPTQPVIPDIQIPERQADAQPQRQHRSETVPVTSSTAIALADNMPAFEPDRISEQPVPLPVISQPKAIAPMEIEAPQPKSQQEVAPFRPTVPAVARVESKLTDDPPRRLRVTDMQTPIQPIEQPDAMQRLADIVENADSGDVVADSEQRLNAAMNPGENPSPSPATPRGLVSLPQAASAPTTQIRPRAPAMIAVRPGDGSQLPSVYQSRSDKDRTALIRQYGGNEQTEASVQAALKWLAQSQGRDGRWDASAFGSGTEAGQILGHQRGGAGANADTAITGLALLAFLAAGQTHYEGDYRTNIQSGLEFLIRSQQGSGNMCGEASFFARMYCHGIATLAVSEAYALTGDHRMRPFVERAINFTVRSQNPADGGWRYAPGDNGDTSQLGWQLMALKSAELAGIPTPSATRAGMIRFLHSVAKGPSRGLASYRPVSAPTRTMTAEAMICRVFLNLEQNPAAINEAANYLLQQRPDRREVNLYYWYYATLALFQLQDNRWRTWNERLQTELMSRQEKTGDLAGSWPPDTTWGRYGGRVYTTAMATLCLEVYYRYLPLYDR